MKESLVSDILFDIKENLSQENVLKYLNDAWLEKSQTREKKFALLTSISLEKDFPITKIEIDGCTIRLLKGNYPKKYKERNKAALTDAQYKELNPHTYRKVIVNCTSRFEQEATSRSIAALNIFRFFLCLECNSGMSISYNAFQTKPINKVQLGGSHTLHLENGKNATTNGIFWFWPDFKEISTKICFKKNYLTISENVKFLLEQFNKCTFKKDLERSILHFMDGFDSKDSHHCLVSAWTAMELLLAKGTESNNDLIPKRCSFLYAENEYHRQILEHLRNYRNNHVHAGEGSHLGWIYCYQLQRYYRRIILHYLTYSTKSFSLTEANELLDTSLNEEEIKAKINLYERSLQFRFPNKRKD